MLLILALLLFAQVDAEKQSNLHRKELVASLKKFVETIKEADHEVNPKSDEQVLKAIDELNKEISDDDLPIVEKFAVDDDAKDAQRAFAYLLAKRERFDTVALIWVRSLTDIKKDRRYRMWKWWEHLFGEREEYLSITLKFTDSLLRQFEKGNADQKLVVAELFGKGEEEAKLTLDEFKKAIHYEQAKKSVEETEASAKKK